jgi:hypothetical protein
MAQRVREMQQHARIAAHAARDICQYHQWRGLVAMAAPAHVPQLTAVARHRLQRGAAIGPAGVRRTFAAACADGFEQQHQALQQLLRLAPFLGRHGLEIGLAQQLALAPRHRGVDLDLLGRRRLILRRVRLVREQRFAQAPVLGRWRRGAGLRLHLGHEHGHHAAGQVRVAPEQGEGLLEQRLVLYAVDEAGGQRVVEVAPAFQPRHLQRRQRQLHAVGAHGHAGRAQHAAEVHDVLGQVARQFAGLRNDEHGLSASYREINRPRPRA